MRKCKLISSIASAALLFTVSAAHAAQNYQVGIMGLYEVSSPQAVIIDTKKIHNLGCKINRTGLIAAAQGKIDLPKPNYFVFLGCRNSLLGSSAYRMTLNSLISGGERLAVMEGDLVNFPNAQRSSPVTGRQYVLKISHYNNKDADKRDSDLEVLTREASQLPDTYVTESFISVHSALGLPTPDEVVVLFYDTPETGDRFRKNNGNLLNKIKKFNQSHLVDAVYYVSKATQ